MTHDLRIRKTIETTNKFKRLSEEAIDYFVARKEEMERSESAFEISSDEFEGFQIKNIETMQKLHDLLEIADKDVDAIEELVRQNPQEYEENKAGYAKIEFADFAETAFDIMKVLTAEDSPVPKNKQIIVAQAYREFLNKAHQHFGVKVSGFQIELG